MNYPHTDIFISYSHSDKKWVEKLRTMLTPLLNEGETPVWDDSHLHAGEDWYEGIRQAIWRAKVAVLLVSADYLASDFIMKHELPLILKAEQQGLRLLWVAVSYSLYRDTMIARYQAVNNPGQPLQSLHASRLNCELVHLCETIKNALRTH